MTITPPEPIDPDEIKRRSPEIEPADDGQPEPESCPIPEEG